MVLTSDCRGEGVCANASAHEKLMSPRTHIVRAECSNLAETSIMGILRRGTPPQNSIPHPEGLGCKDLVEELVSKTKAVCPAGAYSSRKTHFESSSWHHRLSPREGIPRWSRSSPSCSNHRVLYARRSHRPN